MSHDAGHESVGAFFDWFLRDPEARQIMLFAERANCTFSEAQQRLRPEDSAAEEAWILYKAHRDRGRCPSCGTHNDEMLDERGRVADHTMWKVAEYKCVICDIKAGLEKNAQESKRDMDGVRFVPEPRGPGEPLHPDIDLSD